MLGKGERPKEAVAEGGRKCPEQKPCMYAATQGGIQEGN